MKIFFKNKGFTLLELLIAVSIIAILASATLMTLRGQGARARDTRRKADLEQLRTALEFHRQRFGTYPTTGGAWRGECTGFGNFDDSTGANGFIPGLAPEFIESLPRDPRSSQDGGACGAPGACYLYRSNGTDYKLLAHCSPENPISDEDPYYDPCRFSWAFQVSSRPAIRGTNGVACNWTTLGW